MAVRKATSQMSSTHLPDSRGRGTWLGHQAVRRLCQRYAISHISSIIYIWSHRLTVRTPGSHPGNPGSIPGEITKVNTPLLWRGIYFGKLSSRARSRRVRESKCSKMSLLILQASGNRELNDRLPGGATRRLLALATQQSHSVLCLKHYQKSGQVCYNAKQ